MKNTNRNLNNLTAHQAEILADLIASIEPSIYTVEELFQISDRELAAAAETFYLFSGNADLLPIVSILRVGFELN